MVTKELRMAAVEINQILHYTADFEVAKIPRGLRMFFKEIADPNYEVNISPDIALNSQHLMEDTQKILGMIYCYYWSTEEEIENMSDEVKENAEEMRQILFKGYPPKSFFGEDKNELFGVPKEEPWYKKIFKRK